MIVDLLHRVEVSSVQRATALRTKVAELLKKEDCTLVESRHAQATHRYKVVGVDTHSADAQAAPFVEDVEAASVEEAKTKAVGSSKTKVVAEVRLA